MEAYQQRVIEERDELKVKLDKLETFGCSPAFAFVAAPERMLLADQAWAMRKYLEILNKRIVQFQEAEQKRINATLDTIMSGGTFMPEKCRHI